MSEWIYGIHPILELLKSRPERISQLMLKSGERNRSLGHLEALAREAGIAIKTVDMAALNRITTGGNHQGVAAKVEEFTYADFDSFIMELQGKSPAGDLVVLDGVQDPHNLGAILRSAEVFQAAGVIIPKDRSAAVTEVAIRASAGAANYMPVYRVVNLARSLNQLKEVGYWIVGTEMKAQDSLFQVDLRSPCAFVFGGEGEGLRRLIGQTCDLTLSLPVLGKIESLNVSVTCGIVLAESYRQKHSL